MIANFFQSLDRNRTDYLLISGQATVLYGAATFSEDIDLTGQLQRRIGDLQQADRRYWRSIISELKELRAAGKLMPEGQAV